MAKKKKKNNFTKYIVILWTLVALFVVSQVALFIMIDKGLLGETPSFKQLENPPNILASEIYTEDGKILDKYFLSENRSTVEYENLPQNLIDALIATEDVRFYKHSGIDLRGLVRVAKGVVTQDLSSGGGSTISQQLAKMLFPRKTFKNKLQLVTRKLKEWVIAVKLEKSYTKEEIINMYLNKYDFGNLAVGIQSAANVYFNMPPDSLQYHQSAMLVGMAKNSSLYNPIRRPEMVLHRRNVVINQMAKYDFITKEERDSLKKLPLDLDFKKVDYKKGIAPYFREYLRLTLNAKKPKRSDYASWQEQKFIEDRDEWENNPLYGWTNKNKKANGEKYDIYADGLKIYTTIDSRMQRYAVEAVSTHLSKNLQPDFDSGIKYLNNPPFGNNMTKKEVDDLMTREIKKTERYRVLKKSGKSLSEIKKIMNKPVEMTIFSWKGDIDTLMSPSDSIKWYLKHLRSSFMAMDNHTGKIKAYVGGPNYRYFMYDMVKGGKRQVGSTVKPFLYTLAMQNGLTPCTKVPYVSQQFKLADGTIWEPKDASRDIENEGKMVTLKWGLANSRNKISAWVMKQFSPNAMVDVMRKLGIYSPIDAVPSMFLGTSDISLYEMVGAFNTYNNLGVFVRPYFVTHIEDRYGNVVATFQPEKHEAINEQTAYLMLNLLRGVIDQGTGIRLRGGREYANFTMPIAGKTGTTQNHSDGWFIGLTPQLSAGVWTGADLRSIHFRTISSGQGANMALPIWGYFMKKVLADKSLGISQDTQFKQPLNFNINLNCDEEEIIQEEETPDDFNDFF